MVLRVMPVVATPVPPVSIVSADPLSEPSEEGLNVVATGSPVVVEVCDVAGPAVEGAVVE